MTGCPSIETLERLLAGSLADPDAASVRQHLDECSRCLVELDRLSDDGELCGWRANSGGAARQFRREAGCVSLLGRLRTSSTIDPAAFDTRDDRGPDLELAPAIRVGDIGGLGSFAIRRELGRGGMGIVLEAFDTELRRDVALKVLRPDRADEKSRARFVREAQAAARVKHENVVTVHSVANPPGAPPYLVMELVRGPTLRQRIAAERRLDPREAARIIAEVADGLAAAHEAGLVHRDVKPSNVLMEGVESGGLRVESQKARAGSHPYVLKPQISSGPQP